MEAKPSLAVREQIQKVRERLPAEHRQAGLYLMRILLAFIIFATIVAENTVASTVLIIASIILSYVDYRRHRKLPLHTQFESLLNAFADKALIILISTALYITGAIPLWAATIFISKDILFFIGGLFVLFKNRYTIFKQTVTSKATLFVQLVALLAPLVDKLDNILLIVAAAMTIFNLVVIVLKPEVIRSSKEQGLNEFAFAQLLKPKDAVTLLGVACALLSIILVLSGFVTASLIALMVCVVIDFLDGKVARWTKTANDFGKQLDSLADTVSFGVAPAIIGLTLANTTFAIAAVTIFLFCGILRLAKFNIMDADGYYIGMPITFNGILIPATVLLGLPSTYIPYVYLFLGMLMIAPVKIQKRG